MEELRNKNIFESHRIQVTSAIESARKAEAQAAAYIEDLVLLKAEYTAYRKQTEKEKNNRISSKEAILRHIVSLLDVLEIAHPSRQMPERRSLSQGLHLLFHGFRTFLAEEGLQEISPEAGDVLDLRLHQVIGAGGGDPVCKIASLVRKGYRYNGSVLRLAHVTVSRQGDDDARG
jgi:molecular chaperone GrpE (heat shock protein)